MTRIRSIFRIIRETNLGFDMKSNIELRIFSRIATDKLWHIAFNITAAKFSTSKLNILYPKIVNNKNTWITNDF